MSQGQTKWIQLPAGHDMTAMVLSAHAMGKVVRVYLSNVPSCTTGYDNYHMLKGWLQVLP
ncbi:hypothetical protein [Pseudoalteromonas luteoviolacea]|uniref:Uncharacterized protein n=1 Tax=Pseudoalteromonas luteoviolacea S4054 TaxID=1129367 RepID=A0A0F6ACY7_9GAMM|nr:hypothetical protein [Pseudoalteromonas luteoviolacea]AOT09774.1 hypothetical protein S4054249_18955 [Pseudoalteromonas luteoviolacea]AOT14687.1 hypothetical protein S40542_18925 [Pseudoalteromonas luteoviolacea]AOT19601.1 hypothetical protein S4054_18930 [Pseudoalteromonas luteoviolacea]KKE84045.1 hypothetical protein N479_11575 [Pseudoalteromonas luteoviolacea S4054]KZN77439.1 hypothetical protein N481_05115 [Pseudoalteromonas luteoviolacea S4047-1]